MRDIIITLIVFGSLPMTMARPWIGILVFSWISYMNPHRLSWGFAYNIPFAMIVAVVTISAYIVSRENKKIPATPVTVFLILYVVWTSITTAFALNPEEAMPQWIKFLKIQLITFMTLAMMTTRNRIHIFVCVIVGSLGFFGVKGGVFALTSGGQYRFWGPPESFIEDNNQLAMALVMTMPLMYYLFTTFENKWLKRGVLFAMLLTLVAILSTYSRGGFIALGVMSLVLWSRGQRRAMLGVVGAAAIMGVLAFMPQKWTERMVSIGSYDEDRSADDRFHAWLFSINVARDRPVFAGGFKVHDSKALYQRYNPEAHRAATAHSIYFEVIGEHGWIGITLFLGLLFSTLRTCGWVRRRTRTRPDLRWARDLSSMVQTSLIGYAAAGAFLNLATFDYYYHLVVVAVVVRQVVQEALQKAPEPDPKTGAETNDDAPATALRAKRGGRQFGPAQPAGQRLGGQSGYLITRR